uniref:Paired domain-containing protein n=1 Tax=Haemonchus contortus TaxID=6289 RepID=A0A7I4Y9U2_HAECO
MTPLDALPYPQFPFYNALNLPTNPLLPYSLIPAIHAMRIQSPQVFITDSSDRNKQGRAYNPGRPLSMTDRERILQLYEKGHKISHIARMIGVTHSCVSKIMTRYRRTGSMYPRSYSVGLLTAPQSALDFNESASECSTNSTSEEWTAAEFSYESCPRPAMGDAVNLPCAETQLSQKTGRRTEINTTVPSSTKISGYSIERLLA